MDLDESFEFRLNVGKNDYQYSLQYAFKTASEQSIFGKLLGYTNYCYVDVKNAKAKQD